MRLSKDVLLVSGLLLGLICSGLYLWFTPEVAQRDVRGRTLLIQAAENGDLKTVENLIERGVDVHARDDCRWTALMCALTFDNHEPHFIAGRDTAVFSGSRRRSHDDNFLRPRTVP